MSRSTEPRSPKSELFGETTAVVFSELRKLVIIKNRLNEKRPDKIARLCHCTDVLLRKSVPQLVKRLVQHEPHLIASTILRESALQ